MITDSKYTKTFVSDGLTERKYRELLDLATAIRDHKNRISLEVSEDLFKYLSYNPLTFVTEMRGKHKGEIGSNFDKQLYQDVIDAYQNKFDAVTRKIRFENIMFKGFEFYKRDCKGHSKGDFKRVVTKSESTPLSVCLTYLARYGNDDTIGYITGQLTALSPDDKKAQFYRNILDKCGKFGFGRLMALALQRRNRVIAKYAEKPVEFKSFSFRGRSRKKTIVGYNSRYGSEINAFVSLSFPTRKSMDIPVKYSKDYHGNMSDYVKQSNDYDYVVCFDERNRRVRINIAKDGERYIPDVSENDKAVGIDVNVKHNLFSLSDGTTYDYDRQLLADYCELKREIDRLKSKNDGYRTGSRRQRKMDTLRMKMLQKNRHLIAGMCRTLSDKGVRHIVMEDLDGSFGKSFVKDDSLDGINFNDIVKFLGISSLKDEVRHIASNYGIAVSTVHSEYTSKACPVCGCIDDGNRQTQEDFCCVECGHKDNADHNASVNILDRVRTTVLCRRLLKQLGNGAYDPRDLKKEKVKEVLLSYRTGGHKAAGNT